MPTFVTMLARGGDRFNTLDDRSVDGSTLRFERVLLLFCIIFLPFYRSFYLKGGCSVSFYVTGSTLIRYNEERARMKRRGFDAKGL